MKRQYKYKDKDHLICHYKVKTDHWDITIKQGESDDFQQGSKDISRHQLASKLENGLF